MSMTTLFLGIDPLLAEAPGLNENGDNPNGVRGYGRTHEDQ
jgi:hypothetical protein